MSRMVQYAVQTLCFGVFAAFIAVLSAWPPYDYRPAGAAVVKLSLSHAAERVRPCVTLTPQEVAALAPNMRQTERCERARLPLTVELDIDGQTLVRIEAPPSGLWNDGPASVYETFEAPPGTHVLTARLRDSARPDGWDYSATERVVFRAGRYFTVTFAAENGGFEFR